MSAITAEQFDLITDDPRVECSSLSELRQFWQASKELGGLLTQSQAARILNVDAGCIHMWIQRGKLQSREVAGVRMVGGVEITALLRQRKTEAKNVGGRGHKSPSLCDLIEAAKADLQGE